MFFSKRKRDCEGESNVRDCVLLPGDGHWYRALVKEILPSGNVKVHFVDYGNVEEVTTEQLQAISPQFLLLPFQGMQCWLVGRCLQGFLTLWKASIVCVPFVSYECTVLTFQLS